MCYDADMGTDWLRVHWVLYMSRARTTQIPATILHIVRSAERRNAGLGVTGLLAYGEGVYLQYLQGTAEPLHGLNSHIAQDFRHRILWVAQGLVGRNRIAPGFPLGYFEIGPELALAPGGPGAVRPAELGPGDAPALIAALLDAAAAKYPSAVAPDFPAGSVPPPQTAPASKR